MKERESQEQVKRALELKEYSLSRLPGYLEWSEKYLDRYPALIANLDSMSIMLHPSEVDGSHDGLFEKLLADLKYEPGIDD